MDKQIHRFQPGNKLSKGGRPRGIAEMRDMAKEYTREMLEHLVEIARDREERGSVRVVAADLVLTRAWGKAESYHDKPIGDGQAVQQLSTNELTALLLEAKAEGNVQMALEHKQDAEQLQLPAADTQT